MRRRERPSPVVIGPFAASGKRQPSVRTGWSWSIGCRERPLQLPGDSMKVKLKPISEQTIVITGASSGIGLCTARLAAERGARVVLAARNEKDLELAVDEITA